MTDMTEQQSSAATRPNVILLMADQLRADALGYAGNPVVQTPNLDRLARSGAVFENTFVQTPVCMASRASIFTGRYPRSIRVPSMGVLPPTETTLAEELHRTGYATGLFGKLHFTPMGYTTRTLGHDYETNDASPFLAAAGIDSVATRAAAEDPMKRNYGFDVNKGVGDHTWGHYLDWLQEVAPEHVQDHVAENWGLGRAGVHYGDSPPATRLFQPTVTDFFDSHMPAEVHPSSWMVQEALAFARANGDRPWFAHVSFVDPHHPFNAAVPYNRLYRPEDMPVPDEIDRDACFPPGLPEGVANRIRRYAEPGPEFWQWARANYYGMVSHIDWCVGRLLDGLEAMGQLDSTLIVFTADHGEYVGDHRLLYKGSLHFDGIMHVPFVVAWGDRLRRGRRVRSMVQQIDIYPTVLSLLDLPIHSGVQGKDLSSVLRGGPEVGYDRVTCELDQLPDPQYVPAHTIRSQEWKLSYLPVARTGMLFNLLDDPGERRNLYFEPGCANVREEMLKDLLQHLYETKDPLPIRLSQA
ncbi:MAG: sulfatase-like hydrolase/transferase [Chloroflexi bacterium]|nr:sulfatase-like hydrolase/transferase [Chloroflexota bacterium]